MSVICQICKKKFGCVTSNHLKTHGMTTGEYKEIYPNSPMVSSEVRAKTRAKLIGNKHLLGYKHSPESRSKMKGNQNAAGHKCPPGLIAKMRGRKHSLDSRKKMSIAGMGNQNRLGHRHSPKTCRRLSIAATKAIMEGRHGYIRGLRGYYVSSKAGRIHYMSSYEHRAFQLLDQDPNVEGFVVQPFRIPLPNGRNYIPDIHVLHVDGAELVIEVKPAKFVNAKDVLYKTKAAEEYGCAHGMEFLIWTENDLFDLKMIRSCHDLERTA